MKNIQLCALLLTGLSLGSITYTGKNKAESKHNKLAHNFTKQYLQNKRRKKPSFVNLLESVGSPEELYKVLSHNIGTTTSYKQLILNSKKFIKKIARNIKKKGM